MSDMAALAGKILALDEERRARAIQRLREKKIGPWDFPLPRADPNEPFRAPLTWSQAEMFSQQEQAPDDPRFHLFGAYRSKTPLQHEALRAALRASIRRHGTLRTRFVRESQRVQQEQLPFHALPLDHCLGPLERVEIGDEGALREWIWARVEEPFSLEKAPLFRLCHACDERGTVLVLVVHHLICDAWSLGIWMNEIAASLRASGPDRGGSGDAALSFAEYSRWQSLWLDQPEGPLNTSSHPDPTSNSPRVQYWRNRLGSTPLCPPELRRHDLPRETPGSETAGAHLSHSLPLDLAQAIAALAAEHQTTPYFVLLTGLMSLLKAWIPATRPVVATTMAERPSAESESILGYFVKTLVVAEESGTHLNEKLLRYREQLAAALESELPLGRILASVRQASADIPEIPVLFVLQQLSSPATAAFKIQLTPIEMPQRFARFALSIRVFWSLSGGAELRCEFDQRVVEASWAAALMEDFVGLLRSWTMEGVLRPEDLRLHPLPLSKLSAGKSKAEILGEKEAAVLATPGRAFVEVGLVETRLRSIWAKVLGKTSIEWDDNFFALGGDSIGSLQVVSLALREGIELSARDLAQAPTLGELARRCRSAMRPASGAAGMQWTAEPQLLPAQRWFFSRSWANVDHYNQCKLLVTRPGLGMSALRKCFAQLVVEHESLRLAFDRDSQKRWRPVAPDVDEANLVDFVGHRMHYFDQSKSSEESAKSEVEAVCAELQTRHRLQEGGLFQIAFFDRGHSAPGRLFVSLHHLVIDGVSWRRLLASWDEKVRGQGDEVATRSAQSFAPQLGAATAIAEQSAREARPAPKAPSFASLSQLRASLAPESTAQLIAKASALGLSIESFLLIALSRSLQAQGASLCIDLESHGRDELVGGSEAIGWLTARTTLHFDPDLRGEDFVPGDLEAELEWLSEVRGRSVQGQWSADARVCCNYHGLVQVALEESKAATNGIFQLPVTVAPEEVGPVVAAQNIWPYALTLNAHIARGRLELTLIYSRDYAYEGIAGVSEIAGMDGTDGIIGMGGISRMDSIAEVSTDAGESYARARLAEVVSALQGFATKHSHPAGLEESPPGCFEPSEEEDSSSMPAQTPGPSSQKAGSRLKDLSFGVGIEGVAAMTPLQQGMLFQELAAPESAQYWMQTRFRVAESIDEPALRAAAQALVQRHSILRTAFVWRGKKQPEMVQLESATMPVEGVDLSDEGGAERSLPQWIREELERVPPWDQPPLFRLLLLKTGPSQSEICITYHHVITDGWSSGILIRDLIALYRAEISGQPAELPPVPPSFLTYARWLHQQSKEDARTYWKQRFRGRKPQSWVPLVAPDYRRGASDQAGLQWSLADETFQALHGYCAQYGITLNTAIQGAVIAALASLSDRAAPLLGVVSSLRPPAWPQAEAMVGPMIATLPLFAPPMTPWGQSCAQWLQALQSHALADREHALLPLPEILACIEEQHRASLPIEVLLVVENFGDALSRSRQDFGPDRRQPGVVGSEDAPVEAAQLPGARPAGSRPAGSRLAGSRPAKAQLEVLGRREASHYPLTLYVVLGAKCEFRLHPRGPRLSQSWCQRWQERLTWILEKLAMDAGNSAANESAPGQGTLWQLLGSEPKPARPHAPGPAVVAEELARIDPMFEIAKKMREASASPAIVQGSTRWDYGALEQCVARMQRELTEVGVGAEDRVALVVCRDPRVVAAMLAIWGAGAAFVPVEIGGPLTKVWATLRQTKPRVLLNPANLEFELSEEFADLSHLRLADLERPVRAHETPAPKWEPCCTHPRQLAYLMMTSGSTGQPKAVAVEHDSLALFLASMQEVVELSAGQRWLSVSSLTFDISILELLFPLCRGGVLELVDDRQARDGQYLARRVGDEEVRVMQATPSTWKLLLASNMRASHLCALCGGEAMSPALAAQLSARVGTLYNVYGPTEATIWSTVAEVNATRERVSIGAPLGHMRVDLDSKSPHPLSPGRSGELLLGGRGLARGYWNDPRRTALCFIPDPHGYGERLYRSGDFGRLDYDGQWECMGRMDRQVKIRGHRIELGEIESALGGIEGLDEAGVVLATGPLGDEQEVLCAFYTGDFASEEVELDGGQARQRAAWIRQRLSAQLVAAAIPERFFSLEVMPLTAAGKVDRKALEERARLELRGLAQKDSSFIRPESKSDQAAASGRSRPEAWSRDRDFDPTGSSPDFAELDSGAAVFAETIANIFAELLGLPTVGIDEDFFAIGGHSLLAVSLVERMEERLGVSTNLGLVLEAATPRALARRLCQQHEEGRPLFSLMTPGRRDKLVYCVHAGGGHVLGYRPLAASLSRGALRPDVWGLSSPQLVHPQWTPNSLEEMAKSYASAVAEHAKTQAQSQVHSQGKSGLWVVGWSFGGVLAWSMVAWLRRWQVEVSGLLLIDPATPGKAQAPRPAIDSAIENAWFHLSMLGADRYDPRVSAIPRAELEALGQDLFSLEHEESRFERLLTFARHRAKLPLGLNGRTLAWRKRALEWSANLVAGHAAETLDVPLSLWWAKRGRAESSPPFRSRPDWLQSSSPIEEFEVDASHTGIVNDPKLWQQLSRQLNQS